MDWESAIYSALVVLREISDCSLEAHIKGHLPSVNTYPVQDLTQTGQATQTIPIQAHSILRHGRYSHSQCDVPPTPKNVIWTCLNVNHGH